MLAAGDPTPEAGMRHAVIPIAIALLALAACAAQEGSRCDDGGSGGVVIDGVCL